MVLPEQVKALGSQSKQVLLNFHCPEQQLGYVPQVGVLHFMHFMFGPWSERV